ncbi:hypothetical protein W97_05936 [Coniosporium apollinis CBS 100218]|uniref:Uncharacterized protein n=1 Tax=Coniosporium apollinis (strain CBS 100218) TaxID=1168221 RepID=R7YXM8_CONA1|nr:uncharacterized protein W97_05936 [Coniosporium apollinis CBS 100218]EON66690.1 hypothetical protein W97_05936 [Coniosporium apollinis CBS 100218]
MLAVRDQENFVHGQQAAAAAKPLNQGLVAKTPGNKAPKTPFKVALNDENVVFRGGKSVLKTNGKGNENLFTGAKKGNELDKNTFVTPAGPRTRAPLGAKTTNAKTKAFQTPAPPSIDTASASAKTQPQSRSPRLHRAKVKVLATDDATKPVPEPEEREIEYMPPRGEPLPDLPDDYWGPEKTFPMFEAKNYMRGIWSTYFNPVDDDGVSQLEREDAVRDKRVRRETDETLQRKCDEMFAEAAANITGTAPPAAPPVASRPTTSRSSSSVATKKPLVPNATTGQPTTLTSRTAATALRQPSSRPHFSAPTTAAKARVPTSALPLSRKKQPVAAAAPTNPSAMRHTAATAASRTTLGYANGRAASSSLRKPLPLGGSEMRALKRDGKRNVTAPVSAGLARGGSDAAVGPVKARTQKSEEEVLVEMLRARGLGHGEAEVEGDDEDDLLRGSSGPGLLLDVEDEFEGFQLAMPEF